MAGLTLRPASSCKWDLVSLGEVMLRLDPGEGRISTAREFKAWEGGGEYNVARGLAHCFGMRTTIVTALADNSVGHLIDDLIGQGGVDRSHIRWVPFDGLGQTVRNGLNFTERGFGIRSALGVSDRGHTAASQMQAGDLDWTQLFAGEGARWFHTGGIYAGLSDTTAEVVREAMDAARANGIIVSFDLNYRSSLWRARGGQQRAREVNRELVGLADVLLGNEEDFTAALGFEVEGLDDNLSALDPANFSQMIEKVVDVFPNLRLVATTLRNAKTATRNDWGAICWQDGELSVAPHRLDLEILDRVGGGDSFASGLIYGLLLDMGPETAVQYGAAHGALAMTTPGDTSMATLAEVQHVVRGGSARIAR